MKVKVTKAAGGHYIYIVLKNFTGQASVVVVSNMMMFTLQKEHAGYCEITLPMAGAEGGGR